MYFPFISVIMETVKSIGGLLLPFIPDRWEEHPFSLFDPLNTVTEREKNFLDRSWTKYFADFIYPKLMNSHMLSYTAIRIHA